jgi:hypothetical protein
LFKSCVKKSIILKGYATFVLILQILFKLINDEKFLKQYGWDKALNSYLESLKIIEYMPVIGFSKPSDADVNIINLFLSPIIFYITTSILKDHFKERLDIAKKETDAQNSGSTLVEKETGVVSS